MINVVPFPLHNSKRGCPVTNMSDTSLEWSKTAGSNSHIDLRSTESIIDLYKDHMTPIDSASWEEFQDKLIRVLNYKHYATDVETLYFNQKYLYRSNSEKFLGDEDVMQTVMYDECEERKPQSRALSGYVYQYVLPMRQTPEVVEVPKGTFLARMWNFLRDIVTLKGCRIRNGE